MRVDRGRPLERVRATPRERRGVSRSSWTEDGVQLRQNWSVYTLRSAPRATRRSSRCARGSAAASARSPKTSPRASRCATITAANISVRYFRRARIPRHRIEPLVWASTRGQRLRRARDPHAQGAAALGEDLRDRRRTLSGDHRLGRALQPRMDDRATRLQIAECGTP